MSERLSRALENIRSDTGIARLDEARVKQSVVLQILNALEWNPFNHAEVTPEFAAGTGRVDYNLQIGGQSKVFIEVKKGGEHLSSHQDQLLRYSFERGVSLAALTNGLEWWFYLPLREGSWEERRFCVIDIRNEDVELSVRLFVDFLSRSGIYSGSAVRSAESRLDTLIKESAIRDALPEAWRSLIIEQDELLVDLIDEKVESLLGFKSGPEPIRRFLEGLSGTIPSDLRHESASIPTDSFRDHPTLQTTPQRTPSVRTRSVRQGGRRGLTGFTFDGESFSVYQWKGLVQTLAEALHRRHPTEFDRVQELRGTKRVYFSFNEQDLDEPREVKGSGYFVETKWGWKASVDLCHKLIHLFGYDEQDLKIDYN